MHCCFVHMHRAASHAIGVPGRVVPSALGTRAADLALVETGKLHSAISLRSFKLHELASLTTVTIIEDSVSPAVFGHDGQDSDQRRAIHAPVSPELDTSLQNHARRDELALQS
jgi:hypothetical protein